jgi:hypothetical protein
MKSLTPDDLARDELLAKYEGGVWAFIAVVGCAFVGIIVWAIL